MRPSSLLFFAVTVAIAIPGCAADDGFRTRLAQGCRSEMECAQLDGFAQERERQAAWAAQQDAVRRGEERARWDAEQARQRAEGEETERRRREEREEAAARARSERAAREKADRDADAAAAASAPRSTPVAPATPAPRDTGGHVCCCDGTLSPTCTTVHRGCCSHHGGVCACD